MKSVECLADGYDQLSRANKRASHKDALRLFIKKRLRKKGRRGPVVVIGIVNPVSVELDLAVIEVEVRGVREVVIGVRIITTRPSKSLDFEL